MKKLSIADLAAELVSEGLRHYCNKRLFSFVNRNLNILGYKAHVLDIREHDVEFVVIVEN